MDRSFRVGAADPFGLVRPSWAVNSTALITIGTANSCWYYRVVGAATISKIRVFVGVQSGNVCAAAYSNTGVGLSALPATQQSTSGSVACPAPGIADIALGAAVAVNAGDWLALACDNTTATFAGITGVGAVGLSSGQAGQQTVSAYPCPASPGAISGANNRLIALIGAP